MVAPVPGGAPSRAGAGATALWPTGRTAPPATGLHDDDGTLIGRRYVGLPLDAVPGSGG